MKKDMNSFTSNVRAVTYIYSSVRCVNCADTERPSNGVKAFQASSIPETRNPLPLKQFYTILLPSFTTFPSVIIL
jgi:hypothetical protein